MLSDRAHRPWPPPERRWSMLQVWHELLFAHWPVEPRALAAWLPGGLELDTREGVAWLGVVPFRMSGVRLRALPAVPGTSAFPELNVRTYVVRDGKPGVWFLSLDAANLLAVELARRWFALPYFRAHFELAHGAQGLRYRCRRADARGAPAELEVEYAPAGFVRPAPPGSLEHWLVERYCLYAPARRGGLLRGEIHHRKWPLQPARARFEANSYAPAALAGAPLLHYAERLEVVIWSPERC